MKTQKGFTLIEMLIVLTIISVLLILIVPNLSQQNETVQARGCDALIEMAQSQVQAYEIEHGALPETLQTLVDADYLKSTQCDGGTKTITLDATGTVRLQEPTS